MKKLITTVALTILMPLTAFAEGGGSASNRSSKQFDVTVQPFGFTVFPVPSQGIAGGYYLNPSMEIELEYTAGSLDLGESSTTTNSAQNQDSYNYKIVANTIGARLKYFWGNSFYTNSGLSSRTIGAEGSATYIVDGTVLYKDKDISFNVTSLTLDIAVGNKWQFENFNIGCDWFGAMIPISVSSTEDELEDELGDTEGAKELEESLKKIGEITTYQMIKFYIGWSF